MNALRYVVGTAAIAVGTLGISTAAGASTPVVTGCVGVTFSDAAHASVRGSFGQTIRGFAHEPDGRRGLGDGIQLVQAGHVPDEVAINACN
jgi:hypothetical protein